MDKKPLVFWGVVALLILMLVLLRLFGKPVALNFSGHKPAIGSVGPRTWEMRGKAEVPIPKRYIEAARKNVAVLMAEPDWQALSLDAKRDRLAELLVLRTVDAEYWALPEPRQRRVAEAFIQAFLGESAGDAVDK